MDTATSLTNPKLSWNIYHRQVLCCLYRFFECSHDQLSVLFSTIFRNDLRHCGFGDQNASYARLHAQWDWLKRQKRPVWYHVHIHTEFRKDLEWRDIIHRIRLTAFELGLLLQEKLFDTIHIPSDDFDVNDHTDEYLGSVLLANQAQEQHSSGDNVVTDEPFAGESSSQSPQSPSTVVTGTPMTDATPISIEDERTAPDVQIPVMDGPPPLGTHTIDDSSEDFDPLVTSHGKACFWCVREGVSLEDDTPTVPGITVDESLHDHNQEINEHSPGLDAENVALADLNNHDSSDLPGLCGVDDLPPLLYRWFNTNSQGINSDTIFVAGCFTRTYPDITSPSQISKEVFLDMFEAHARRVKIPTPFVSVFARQLAPIHRALRNRNNAKISVIDPRKIQNSVFHAQLLARTTRTEVDRWKGYGEFAVWGCIPGEAVISTFDITTLEDIASRNIEIREFLQLSLIKEQSMCDHRLRRLLRANLEAYEYEDCYSLLERLARELGVPREFHESFAMGMYQAWTRDLGGLYREREDLLHPPSVSFEPPITDQGNAPIMDGLDQRFTRSISESTTSYMPTKSDDGSCSESSSDEEDTMSQSPEAICPRRDTASPDFSVASDTDDSVELNFRPHSLVATNYVEMLEVAVLPTPSSTSRYFYHSSNVSLTVPPLTLGTLNLSTTLNDGLDFDDEPEWPLEGETFDGNNTPTRSRYFNHNGGYMYLPRLSLQEQDPFVLSDDEMEP
ncbi:hypothetical protein PEBR_19683 [Penicillium brasilianum]|uniref:DUF7587 domain-containing protein n=1 Tax=Penicillium brasilianum TaxID=104259 RepID=A0A1S9RMR1_PENBI|nr:hypothetical protein PEBR_19683 [Penicillium brasilianum]